MKRTLLVVALAVSVSFLGTGCGGGDSEGESGSSGGRRISRSIGEPIDYLPTSPGYVLAYKIELGEEEPLHYQEVIWPTGRGGTRMSTRGRFRAAMPRTNEVPQRTFLLKLTVKGPAAKQGGLEYPIGVELTVDKDELGVYEDAKGVFWAAGDRDGFMCHEVVTYDANSSEAPQTGPWGSWGGEDGYSMRVLYFGEKPGTQIGLGRNPADNLLFEGLDQVPGMHVTGLHFVRTVSPEARKNISEEESDDKGASLIASGFKEDVYFVKGKGLVYLQQKVRGKISMIWRRVDYL